MTIRHLQIWGKILCPELWLVYSWYSNVSGHEYMFFEFKWGDKTYSANREYTDIKNIPEMCKILVECLAEFRKAKEGS